MKKTKRVSQWKTINLINLKKGKTLGVHLVADFWFGRKIEAPSQVKKILITAAKKAGNTPLKVAIHRFSPQGITGVLLLAESHIALHSWPEYNYLAIDIFTCGNKAMPERALDYLKKIFKPKKIKIKKITRGKIKQK